MAIEIEIKLAFEKGFSEPQIKSLETVLKSMGFELGFVEKELVNCYYDTPDFLLNKNKVALRVRCKRTAQGESVFIQTLKTAGESINGLSRRGEWEWPVSENGLDASKLVACEAWPEFIEVETLQIVFETNFTRYQTNIRWRESIIELVVDWGLIVSNDKQEQIHEIELELKQGEQNDLISLSEQLKAQLTLVPSNVSKAERGFKLFHLNS